MTILVLAAHPDDEVLGCGATIARHAKGGETVHIVFASDGETSRGEVADSAIRARQEMAMRAAEVLGAEPPVFLGFPDNRLDSLPMLDLVQAIEAAVADILPRRVYSHHVGDLNVDHSVLARACLTVFRPQPGCSVEDIFGFEVLSSTNWNAPHDAFNPTVFINTEGFENQKIEALQCYAAEMRAFPHARSVEMARHLLAVRGAVVGLPSAEAFTLLRRIEP